MYKYVYPCLLLLTWTNLTWQYCSDVSCEMILLYVAHIWKIITNQCLDILIKACLSYRFYVFDACDYIMRPPPQINVFSTFFLYLRGMCLEGEWGKLLACNYDYQIICRFVYSSVSVIRVPGGSCVKFKPMSIHCLKFFNQTHPLHPQQPYNWSRKRRTRI